jgi:outer membrane lipoprotein-sorting protein
MVVGWLVGAVAGVAAQQEYRPAAAQEIHDIRKKIETASAGLKSLKCDFEQTKSISILAEEMKSSGFMIYRYPDTVHWEYVQPYRYVFSMNGRTIAIESGGRKDEIDVNSGKLFKEISAVILSSINGRGIFDENRFSSKYFTGTSGFLLVLSPKQKEIKQLFSEIHLFFDAADHTVYRVSMQETNGDRTVISMKNKKINSEIHTNGNGK